MTSGTVVRALVALCGMTAACVPTSGDVVIGDVAPDFLLVDQNPASAFVGRELGPSFFRGEASAWYFGHAN